MIKTLITLKNGVIKRSPVIFIKYSKFDYYLLESLWDEGFIVGYVVSTSNGHKTFKVYPKYKHKQAIFETSQPFCTPSSRMKLPFKLLWKTSNQRICFKEKFIKNKLS
jgi:ribosomal protein S8